MEEGKVAAVTKSVNELGESYSELFDVIKSTINEVKTTKKLWREGNKSKLIKIGMTLIMFPEPTPASETIGAFFLAAGVVQKGIRKRTIYIEDIRKTFQNTLKEVLNSNIDLTI